MASPALGHEGNPDFRSEIDSVRPSVPGVSFEVLNYDADIELVDRGGHETVIYGYEGESGTLRWHHHRSHYMATGTPPQVKDESKRTKVFDYEVPIRIDGEKGAIDGTPLLGRTGRQLEDAVPDRRHRDRRARW